MPDDDLTIPFDEEQTQDPRDDESIPLLGAEEEEAEEETISLSDPLRGPSAVRAIRSSLDIGKKADYKRPVNVTGTGATRCRLFHCKIADSSLEHLENQINEWIDDEGVEVKHVGHMVGLMEGKHTEPNVIVIVWY